MRPHERRTTEVAASTDPSVPDPEPPSPELPAGVSLVREELRRLDRSRARGDPSSAVPVAVHPVWEEAFPWMIQGITTRGGSEHPFDLALFGEARAGRVQERWTGLAEATGCRRMVHGRQVHGAAVRLHPDGPPGLHVVPATDGHAATAPGLLLTMATADCVPVYLVDPWRRAVALLHAGWRGVAAGVLETGVALLGERLASRPGDLHVHLGPAICGGCYEVGPEVHEALELPGPGEPTPVDLRAVLARRAVARGVAAERVTISEWCTLCDREHFFSHRGGDRERQVAFAGLRR